MLETLILSVWEYVKSAGTWAVIAFLSNGLWIWLFIRIRKESKETYDELSGIIGEKEKALQDEKDARREEALQLQGASYESLAKLVTLMEKNDETLKKIDGTMLGCIKFQDAVTRMKSGGE